jgi:hypothetical protein
MINHERELEKLVVKMGFLPFFRNEITEFSVEEFTPSALWFSDEDEGPWEWKGPILRNRNCAYGKLFRKKAGFVSMEWFPDLVNYRRSMYQYKLKEDPSQNMDRLVYNTVVEHESLLSKEIKILCGYRKKPVRKSANPFDSGEPPTVKTLQTGNKAKKEGFETIITHLQMGTWLVVADFEYLYNKQGEPYGWGIARYTTPEALFGKDMIRITDQRSPEESRQRLTEYLSQLLPQATHTQILHMIG